MFGPSTKTYISDLMSDLENQKREVERLRKVFDFLTTNYPSGSDVIPEIIGAITESSGLPVERRIEAVESVMIEMEYDAGAGL